mmetsp:Transcript_52005/g.156079  ORF Transcript_52005/g.156079 Transcript_52005/m.156079 type:complete len:209 (+) Transcript_52005:521-1147(+)
MPRKKRARRRIRSLRTRPRRAERTRTGTMPWGMFRPAMPKMMATAIQVPPMPRRKRMRKHRPTVTTTASTTTPTSPSMMIITTKTTVWKTINAPAPTKPNFPPPSLHSSPPPHPSTPRPPPAYSAGITRVSSPSAPLSKTPSIPGLKCRTAPSTLPSATARSDVRSTLRTIWDSSWEVWGRTERFSAPTCPIPMPWRTTADKRTIWAY